jgi:hypothetical protein
MRRRRQVIRAKTLPYLPTQLPGATTVQRGRGAKGPCNGSFCHVAPESVVHLIVRNDFSYSPTGIRLVHRRSPVSVSWPLGRLAFLEIQMESKAVLVSPALPVGQIGAAIRTHLQQGHQETGRPTARLFRPCRSSHKTWTLRQTSSHWQESHSTFRSSEILDSYHHRSL